MPFTQIITMKKREALKKYKCDGCDDVIHKGDTYFTSRTGDGMMVRVCKLSCMTERANRLFTR